MRTLTLLLAAALMAPAGVAFSQAPSADSQAQHPSTMHLDNQPGGTPAPHGPTNPGNRADGGGNPAHLHVQGNDTSTHRPNAGSSQAGGAGPAAHMDNQPGDTPAPHRPGRGAP